jgi:SAM-dependent methyltransferase
MQYGVDIAHTRLDDLDRRLLNTVRERVDRGEVVSVLDVGCGQGGLALALARIGATVTAIDIVDYSPHFQKHTMTLNAEGVPGSITFEHGDLRTYVAETVEHFDYVVLQRVLHYVPYAEAQLVLQNCTRITTTLYLSLTGATTAIAEQYEALGRPLLQRWGTLDSKGQELFSMTAPLCIYTAEEVRQLLADTGWYPDWLRVSDFGNVKVIAHKKTPPQVVS